MQRLRIVSAAALTGILLASCGAISQATSSLATSNLVKNSSSERLTVKFKTPTEPSSPSSRKTLAQVNRELKAAGKKLIPTEISLDLGQSAAKLNAEFWKLSEALEEATDELHLSYIPNKGACFTGNNKKVADAIVSKLTDGWLSDQFTVSGLALRDPNHIGIKYSETDDGDDVNWMNIERCEK